VASLVVFSRGDAGQLHTDPPVIGIGQALGWLVRQQILSAQFVADNLECAIELRKSGRAKKIHRPLRLSYRYAAVRLDVFQPK